MTEMKSEKPQLFQFESQLLCCLAFLLRASYVIALSLIPHLTMGILFIFIGLLWR